jgi:hypothetical protein
MLRVLPAPLTEAAGELPLPMMLVRGVEAPLRWPSASSLLTLEEPVELTVDVRRMDLSSPPEDEDEAADEDDGAADGEAEVAGESESVSSLGDEPVLLLVDDDEDEWWWWCFCCSLCRSDGMAGVLGGQGRRCRSGDGTSGLARSGSPGEGGAPTSAAAGSARSSCRPGCR